MMVAKKPGATAPADDEIARERLEVLELAARLGNAAEACRRSGVDRTSFYQWKRRYAREGLAGLRNRRPVHQTHPQTTPADVSRRVVTLALNNPAQGCDRIAVALAREGIDLSGVTVQKILHKAGLGVYETRAAALETRFAGGGKLNAQQIQFLESMNPCFRDRQTQVARPGELLVFGTFFLGTFEVPGAIYAHAFVDRHSSYAFCKLATDARIASSLAALRDQVLPFFRPRRLKILRLLSCGLSTTSALALSEYARSEGIEHTDTSQTPHGFIERFRRATIAEFICQPFARRLPHAGIGRFEREMAEWLAAYNRTRPQLGYPNYGATAARAIEASIGPTIEEVRHGTSR
jgi:transposase-like protein